MPSVTGITWNTESVMARYRELGSGVEASRAVLWELAGPAWTYARGDESKKPPMSLQSVPTTDVPTGNVPTCEACHERPAEGRYRKCSACRKAEYRERSQG